MNTTHAATAVCSACQYWSHPSSKDEGECRRHAPQTLVFSIDDQVKFESRFPVTKASDWCGEFKFKPA